MLMIDGTSYPPRRGQGVARFLGGTEYSPGTVADKDNLFGWNNLSEISIAGVDLQSRFG